MKGSTIFKKLTRGYKSQIGKKLEPIPISIVNISADSFTPKINIPSDSSSQKKEDVFSGGIEIPELINEAFLKRNLVETTEQEKVNFVYPLIPEKPTKEDPIMAYAKIFWNQQTNRYEYHIVQPALSKNLSRIFIRIKEILEEKLDVDFTKMKEVEAKDYLHNQVGYLLKYFGINITKEEENILLYFIDRDFIGLGPVEPFMHDPDIEDVSCDGVNIPFYVFHRNSKIGSVATNIMFNEGEELDSYLIRLAQLTGKAISVLDPLLDGTLPDGSRIQGTLGTDIAKKGSNFTIRKFTKIPFTPAHLFNYETLDVKSLAFLWMAVDFGYSILASGGTATGKTSFLNVLSLFIRPAMKIVSIEDTGEIQLHHQHWIPQVARVPFSEGAAKNKGDIDLFDLLRESLRQRPDYIIVGEVRGKEAYVLFQQMATGHASLATIHAESFEKLVDRLITPPIELPPSLVESLDLIVFLTNLRYRGNFVRKLQSILEVTGYNFDKNRPLVNKVIEWDPETDKWVVKGKSFVLEKIKRKTGWREEQITEELKRRMLILKWMKENQITDYIDVTRIVNLYYTYPEEILDSISGGT